MRTILIVFATLLLLLTLLGAFGGSIKYSEPFYEVAHRGGERFEPEEPMDEGFVDQDQETDGPKSEFYDMPPPKAQYEDLPPMPQPKSTFEEQAMTGPPMSVGGQSAPPPPTDLVQEGFAIEPFEQDTYASIPSAY